MTTDDEEPMATRSDRPIPNPSRSHPSKPSGRGAMLLSLLLQALVMAVALLLFFLFAGFASFVLAHIFVAGRYLGRYRRRNPNPNLNASGLSDDALKNLPYFYLSGAIRNPLKEDCAVCLEGLREGQRCRLLPSCGHCFHKDCVDRWLVRTPACPLCRGDMGMGDRKGIAVA